MKKILAILTIVIITSCSKSTPTVSTKPYKVFIRIETVEQNGESTFSPISVVSMK